MVASLFSITWRHYKLQRTATIINLIGLTLGLATALLLTKYVVFELSYDRYHVNANRIARATSRFDSKASGYRRHFARFPYEYINHLPDEFPEIETLIRFQQQNNQPANLRIGETKWREKNWFFTDPEVFSVFSFHLLEGDPSSALREPNSVVLTTNTARKYFGDRPPLGREIVFLTDNHDRPEIFTVTGILADLPANSHFQIACLASWLNPDQRRGWGYIYLLLRPGTDLDVLQAQMPAFVARALGADAARSNFIELQRLTDIHLHSHLDRELQPNGDIHYILIFTAVGLLVLILAGFNYANLSTALISTHLRTIAIRKVLGEKRRQIIFHSLFHSLLLSLLAFCAALILDEICSPGIEALSQKPIGLAACQNLLVRSAGFGVAVLLGILGGIYPALLLAITEPAQVLTGGSADKVIAEILTYRKRNRLRRVLVTLQFIIAIALVIVTITFGRQFRFLQNANLGLNPIQLLAINDITPVARSRYPTFRKLLLQHPGITDVSAVMDQPSKPTLDGGFVHCEGFSDDQRLPAVYILPCDRNFIDFMEMKLVSGNNFSILPETPETVWDLHTESEILDQIQAAPRGYILNETAVKTLGISSAAQAVGRQMSWSTPYATLQEGPIIGVVEDFHYSSLRHQIEPMVLTYEPLWLFSFLIRVHPANLSTTMQYIREQWDLLYPTIPFNFEFTDESFARLYRSEQLQSRLMLLATGIAVMMAGLGLFGLLSINLRCKIKEIAIRKIHGAAGCDIARMLIAEYFRLILIANMVAWPLAWWLMTGWLRYFAYRIALNGWIFLIAGGGIMLTALLTLGYHIRQATRINPAEALKYE